MMNKPDFAAMLATINAEQRNAKERELELIDRWTSRVTEAVDAMPVTSVDLLVRPGMIASNEAVAIMAAVYRGLLPNSHIDSYRSALASLSDAIIEMRGQYERDCERAAEDEEQHRHWSNR